MISAEAFLDWQYRRILGLIYSINFTTWMGQCKQDEPQTIDMMIWFKNTQTSWSRSCPWPPSSAPRFPRHPRCYHQSQLQDYWQGMGWLWGWAVVEMQGVWLALHHLNLSKYFCGSGMVGNKNRVPEHQSNSWGQYGQLSDFANGSVWRFLWCCQLGNCLDCKQGLGHLSFITINLMCRGPIRYVIDLFIFNISNKTTDA